METIAYDIIEINSPTIAYVMVFFALPIFSSSPYAVRICIPPMMIKRKASAPAIAITMVVIEGKITPITFCC